MTERPLRDPLRRRRGRVPAGHACLSGFTDEEQREIAAWPHKERMFAHLCGVPGPLRVDEGRGVAAERLPTLFGRHAGGGQACGCVNYTM